MRTAFRKWHNMILGQPLHLATAVHTAMAVCLKNFAPLCCGEIVDGCPELRTRH
jgi:hypothetical protein